nr:ABC transporter ATP-binding protein [Rhodococcus sp. HNM0569]
MHLSARVESRGIDVALDVDDGEVLAVLGPNGAGKSTVLSVIAGLLRPDEGRVALGGRVLTDTAEGVAVPAFRRGVALLAQQPLLFPHMTARANVAFAPRSAGARRRDAAARADRLLDAVGAAHLAQRKPAQLSGGQAQRVAVARALAADPALLLLDEPMAALDVETAPALRTLLRTVLAERGRTAIVVTHDVLDALALADRAVVIDAGRVVEAGTVRDVLARPRSEFAARTAGLDLVPGVATVDGVRTDSGTVVHGLVDDDAAPGERAVAVFAPNAVAIHRVTPEGSPRNVFPVVVNAVDTHGSLVRVRADLPGVGDLTAEVTAAAAAELDLVPGARVWFAVKATEVAVHAAART